LHFRFRSPGAVNEAKFGGQITKVLAAHVVAKRQTVGNGWPPNSVMQRPAGAITMHGPTKINLRLIRKISSGIPKCAAEPGREPKNSEAPTNVRFGAAPAVIQNR
jgi:hypothetical protein